MASLLIMGEAFYTSTEASQITGCSRRQLQYWRKQEVIVPTVNPGGKGRNVYYSESDLIDLAIMEYLLSMNLNFDFCVGVLYRLRSQPVFLFSILLLVHQGLYKLGLILQRQYQANGKSKLFWSRRDGSMNRFFRRKFVTRLLAPSYTLRLALEWGKPRARAVRFLTTLGLCLRSLGGICSGRISCINREKKRVTVAIESNDHMLMAITKQTTLTCR